MRKEMAPRRVEERRIDSPERLDRDHAPALAEEERAVVAKAAEVAATLDWSGDPWHALADALKSSTGQKGRALFHPLRVALTGRDSGPEMAGLLRRIGKERALARLSAAAKG